MDNQQNNNTIIMSDPNVREGQMTKEIENQTAKLPSTMWLGFAVASMVGSAILKMSGENHKALFVGQWAAPFLLLGVYNKIVKTEGND